MTPQEVEKALTERLIRYAHDLLAYNGLSSNLRTQIPNVQKHKLLHSPREHAKYLLKKENRWYLKHSNKKAIIAVVLQARAPWLLGLYNRLIGQK